MLREGLVCQRCRGAFLKTLAHFWPLWGGCWRALPGGCQPAAQCTTAHGGTEHGDDWHGLAVRRRQVQGGKKLDRIDSGLNDRIAGGHLPGLVRAPGAFVSRGVQPQHGKEGLAALGYRLPEGRRNRRKDPKRARAVLMGLRQLAPHLTRRMLHRSSNSKTRGPPVVSSCSHRLKNAIKVPRSSPH